MHVDLAEHGHAFPSLGVPIRTRGIGLAQFIAPIHPCIAAGLRNTG
jgi:hypothetical protein